MNLIKTSFYTSIATAISFISGFITTKVVAQQIGPQGVAYVGQFQNTVAIFTLLSTGLIGTGVVKYLAQFGNDVEKQKKIITTGYSIVLVCAAIITVIVLLSSGVLSQQAFKTKEYQIVYILYGSFVIFAGLNNFLANVLNGLKKIRYYTTVNIIGSLAGICITTLLAYTWGVKGVLLAINFTAVAMFLANVYFLKDVPHFSWKPNFKNWDKQILKYFGGFVLMSAMAFLPHIAQLVIRNTIIKDYGIEQAGFWQAVVRISDYYLAFITSVIAVYYLPKLSEITDTLTLRKEIITTYKIILPVVILLALGIWLCRDLVIQVLFTTKFNAAEPLFKFQLIGDVLKITSWLLAYLMVAKAKTLQFISTEIIFTSIYILLSVWCINKYGIIGATYAFSIHYLIYGIAIFFLLRKMITVKNN
jgi:polysaccharide transporter, PST family